MCEIGTVDYSVLGYPDFSAWSVSAAGQREKEVAEGMGLSPGNVEAWQKGCARAAFVSAVLIRPAQAEAEQAKQQVREKSLQRRRCVAHASPMAVEAAVG